MQYHSRDRRPIPARELALSRLTVKLLIHTGISANGISILSVLFGLSAGISFAITGLSSNPRIWWMLAAVFILLRLIANMLDGMVAIEKGETSAIGELFNEVPDRISDVAIFVGAGFAANSSPYLGFAAAILSLLVAYTRTLGNHMSVFGLFIGPMNKQQRMFTLIAVCLYYSSSPFAWQSFPLLVWCLWMINTGCIITIARRLRTISRKAGA